jgi:outer membrane murein-binding lipoprotein Lpp
MASHFATYCFAHDFRIQDKFMLENSVIQITTGKLVAVSLLPSSVLLVGGIIIWRVWHSKQTRLQSQTDELNDELSQIKQQMSELQTAKTNADSDESLFAQFPKQPQPPQQEKPEGKKGAAKMGLFEYLIEDNVQLREQAS